MPFVQVESRNVLDNEVPWRTAVEDAHPIPGVAPNIAHRPEQNITGSHHPLPRPTCNPPPSRSTSWHLTNGNPVRESCHRVFQFLQYHPQHHLPEPGALHSTLALWDLPWLHVGQYSSLRELQPHNLCIYYPPTHLLYACALWLVPHVCELLYHP